MGKMSINKGSEYERSIARLLSTWAGFKLIRTPMSGAWSGTSGDIIPENSALHFPFLVECKKQENWCFEAILAGNGCFYDWLGQLDGEVSVDKLMTGLTRIPLLIFSRNHKPNYIAYYKVNMRIPHGVNHVQLSEPSSIIIMQLGDFLHAYNYQVLAQSIERPVEDNMTLNSDF